MTVRYADHVNNKATPQTEPIPGDRQIQNHAGGYAYEVDKWQLLARFLVLGAAEGTYYVAEKALTRENAAVVVACAIEDAARTVRTIVEVSDAGRAPKNDPAILALAVVAASPVVETRALAYAALPKVCRIPTHLFHFLAYCKAMRGWSRGLRRAVAQWYGRWEPDTLAFELVKYQARDGWANKDAFRLAHGTFPAALGATIRWAVGGYVDGETAREVRRKNASNRVDRYPAAGELPAVIGAYEDAKTDVDLGGDGCVLRHTARIRQFGLTREMLPTEALNSVLVWEALLEKMPVGALIRNLGKMTAVGLLAPGSSAMRDVVLKLGSIDYLRKGRTHPLAVLNALRVYAKGTGDKGHLTWAPVPQVIDALNDAFYATFGNVEPTGKRLRLALDISGSMSSPIAGTALSCREACAALALVTAAVEPNYEFVGFSTSLVPLGISLRQRLDDVVKYLDSMPFGGTDCSLPMTDALKHKRDVDAFAVFTDNETWAGHIHPSQALQAYRRERGIGAKLVVVGMTATQISIADPKDPGMLDVVGFDMATPSAISAFIAG